MVNLLSHPSGLRGFVCFDSLVREITTPAWWELGAGVESSAERGKRPTLPDQSFPDHSTRQSTCNFSSNYILELSWQGCSDSLVEYSLNYKSSSNGPLSNFSAPTSTLSLSPTPVLTLILLRYRALYGANKNAMLDGCSTVVLSGWGEVQSTLRCW